MKCVQYSNKWFLFSAIVVDVYGIDPGEELDQLI